MQQRETLSLEPAYVRGMERLIAAVQDLSLARNLDAIREIVRKAARELTAADGATFVLREGNTCFYMDEDAIAPLWKGKRFPMTACISGWSMMHRTAVAIEDIYADPRIPVDAYRPTFVQSLAMVPIRTAAPIGAIGNYWATSHRASPVELQLLQALADSTSVAIENAQVYAELESRVQERTQQLEQVNQELQAFSYSVSHDLRAPLRAIDGFSAALAEDYGDRLPHDAKGLLVRIRTRAVQMSQLIEDLLALSQVGRSPLHRTSVDLAEVARGIVDELRAAEPQRDVAVEIPETLAATADRRLLTIALQNLLANAWKYSCKTAVARIAVGRETVDGETAFFVNDNGAGFDPTYASKLFTPFQRLHSADDFEGTGIGLAIVQRIIARHGGRIWADGAVGRGATFRFTLPESS